MIENKYPFEIAKSIAADTEKNMTTNIGRLKILEQFDELPMEYRSKLLQMLSSFHRPQIGLFFQMIRDEYGTEYCRDIERVLRKLKMAGVDIAENPQWFQGDFYSAFCTPTRHMGALSMSIFWKISEDDYMAECFLLNFGTEGISNFVLVENISQADMEEEQNILKSLIQLSLQECRLLLTMSFSSSRKKLVRPSLGHYLYKRHILPQNSFCLSEMKAVTNKVSAFLYGKRLINSFILALRNDDMDYVLSLFSWKELSPEKAMEFFQEIRRPGMMFLEGRAESVVKGEMQVVVKAYIMMYYNQQIFKYQYDFSLSFYPRDVRWQIESVKAAPAEKYAVGTVSSLLQNPLYVRVYDILDMEVLLNGLDSLEQVQKVGELPYGLHLRICTVDDTFFERGVSMMSGVVADLIVNGEEFAVLADQEAITMEFDGKFQDCVELKQAHKISLNQALQYYQGQCQCFEELLEMPEGYFPQDPMCFVTVCYMIYNREPFEKFIQGRQARRFELDDDRILYYQFGQAGEIDSFEAEYILDGNYLAISAFGEAALSGVRREAERALKDCLKFEHLEVNPYGFFEILTPDVKENIPELEGIMKKIYLNKWYISSCQFLEGMSPKEALDSEHGRRLLWNLLKSMSRKPDWFMAGKFAAIPVQEFFQCLETQKNIKRT